MALLRLKLQSHRVSGSASKPMIRGVACGLLLLALSASVTAQEIQAPESKVKAVFLYNFAKLVYWPTNAFAGSNAPLVVGVLGKDPVGKELENVLAGRIVGGRKIQTARFDSAEAATNCHVLFISESERRKLDAILDALQTRPILTVGDTKGFAARGAIELVKTNASINLRINLAAAQRAGLQLSSHLTRLDRTLRPPAPSSTNAPAIPK